MFEKIRIRLNNCATQITWFLIGYLIACGLREFNDGNYAWAAALLFIAGVNYVTRDIKI